MDIKSFATNRIWGPAPHYPLTLGFESKTPILAPISISGPCSIESPEQCLKVALELQKHGISYMRGGVFRAGTYPGKDFGLDVTALTTWKKIAKHHQLKIIVEVLDVRQLELIDQYADAFQIGARACQNYVLLRELGNQNKPVTLKRHPGISLDEFLGACEHLLVGSGNVQPILIERGSTANSKHVRWSLDLSIITAIKQMTKIPILVDPSHGTGRRDLVESMLYAGIAAGADGWLIEIHPQPEKSLSDADQAFPLEDYGRIHANALDLWGKIKSYKK